VSAPSGQPANLTVRIVIAGGGTGGHTSPGLAVAARLRESGVDVHWIGSRAGIEAKRVPEAGLTFHTIPVGKLRRYWDWQNVPDLAVRAPAGLAQSWRLLRRLRPALLLATGGFVALPPALAARTLGIPLVIHEQTSVPGLANRVAGRFARRIALTFPLTGTEFPKERTVLTGNPLRPELRGGTPAEARRRFELDSALPIVYVTGGALGAHRINRDVGAALPHLLEVCQVIHQCGDNARTGDRAWLAERAPAPPLRLDRLRRARAARRLRGGRARRRAQRRGHGQRVLPARPGRPLRPAAGDQRRRADSQRTPRGGRGRRRGLPAGLAHA
jgi:UDP-N-acetylglucosamine--N-acetylmuramyl-(pentapeptide) pyrophosphoryl-undecaprenol N-acetylglucosamine transferase